MKQDQRDRPQNGKQRHAVQCQYNKDCDNEEDHALVSISEAVDTHTAAGRLVLTILGAMGAWEREAIGERTTEVLAHLKSQGVKLGTPPYGWQRTEEVDKHGRYKIERVAEEQEIVRRARALRRRGLTLRAVGDKLEEEGHETRGGGRWHPKVVRDMVGEGK